MKNATELFMILDKSFSMFKVRQEVVSGFNSFIAEQKSIPGEVNFTLMTFNNNFNFVFQHQPLHEIPPLTLETYQPDNNTALLYSLGCGIEGLGEYLAQKEEQDRPDKVMVIVFTDGKENSSSYHTEKFFDLEKIKEMVKKQTEVYQWEFLFLGANIDAFATGGSIGIAAANTVGYANSSDLASKGFGYASSRSISYRVGGKQ